MEPVHTFQLDWQHSAALAGTLFTTRAVLLRRGTGRPPRGAPYLAEATIVAGLYGLWQFAGHMSLLGATGAFERARQIVALQHRMHLPSERLAQRLIGGHPILEQAANLYYAAMNFAVLGGLLIWLFARHRERYPRVRNVLVLLTALSLLIQLVPVAPPRMLPDLGFLDTAARYGQSVYNLRAVTVDQLAAMPSVHVGWSLLVAWAVIRVSPSRRRWWVLGHPVITVFVVAATANHYWLDGIVAALLLPLSIGIVARARDYLLPTKGILGLLELTLVPLDRGLHAIRDHGRIHRPVEDHQVEGDHHDQVPPVR